MNRELAAIELALDKHKHYMNNLLLGYESVTNTLALKREGKHLPSENIAYASLVNSAGSYLGNCEPMHMDALPKTLDELSTENFKLRVKAVASTVWRAVSEALGKFKRLMGNWFNKLKELLAGSSNEDDLTKLSDAVKASELLFKEYNFKHGDKVPEEELEKMQEAHPDTPLFVDSDGKVMGHIALENNLLKFTDYNADFMRSLGALSLDKDVSNIYVNVKEAINMLSEFNDDKYLEDVIVYARNMANISSKRELDAFVDNDLGLTEKAYMTMLKSLNAKQGRDKDSHRTGEVIGGSFLVVKKNKKGNFVYPRVKVESTPPKGVSKSAVLTLAQVIDINRMADSLISQITNAHKSFDLLMGVSEEITAGNGGKLEQIVNTVKVNAGKRDESEVDTIITELKGLTSIITGWGSSATAIGTLCNSIKANCSDLTTRVVSGANANAKKGKRGKSKRK